ncbi:hypothetical protein GUJ93_ZPchr0005g15112 [Zizania palustris]|uniref:Uncharacterized protein n=1 Tax=Zizania palustris TaxID=103762 RepID=A0A8J5SQL4_ZIZPA|nr:hypothetical protein GUJ93_ZPchr0005g15112 [Zizania palustris]
MSCSNKKPACQFLGNCFVVQGTRDIELQRGTTGAELPAVCTCACCFLVQSAEQCLFLRWLTPPCAQTPAKPPCTSPRTGAEEAVQDPHVGTVMVTEERPRTGEEHREWNHAPEKKTMGKHLRRLEKQWGKI